MGNIKGTGYKAEILFIRKKYGDAVFEQIVNRLTPEDQKVMKGAILLDHWYPSAALERYRQAIVSHFKEEGPTVMEEMGRNSADFALTTIYRIFLSMSNPMFIIKRAGSFWPRYFDTGKVDIIENGKNDVTVRIRDWEDASTTLCTLMRGYFSKTLELSGGRLVQVREQACRARNDPYCEYRLMWV